MLLLFRSLSAAASTTATTTFRIDAKLNGVTWTEITDDVARGSVRHFHGIDGNGPLDLVAGSGEMQFDLQNFAKGSRPAGYYSPGHASVRVGWNYGVQVRAVYNSGSGDVVRWIGKVAEIDPDADPHGQRL